jgi:two-component system cell cycle sensor histidine kinase/response regulator CckA
MSVPLRVLFVEDQPNDVELLLLELRRGKYEVVHERVDTPEGFAAALDGREWDLVLCDWRMPRFSAPAALAMVKEKRPHLPFIVISGTIGDETAVEALRAGAHDFLTKARLSRLLPAIDRELREAATRAEKGRIEEQYRQAQKMEAIGHFAGGIAHDFNNLLTVITGYVELSLAGLSDRDPLHQHLREVREASERAATLVRQISAFSRQQIVHPRVFDLNSVMARMDRLLQRVIGEDMEFVMTLAPDLGRIRADPGQIEQVLMNLVVNARDAMPDGGRLVVETSTVELRAGDAPCGAGLLPGPHVLLSVTDTGTGMDERTKARIFEPFFTTKEEGKGTGLGLATVYGIVKQCGASVSVESAPGRGSAFRIHFPRVDEAAEALAKPADRGTVVGGTETILVVEDEKQIRGLAVQVLRKNGYRVFEAATPADALSLTEAEKGEIDLMVTDVIMPGMSGADLAERLSSLRPRMRVLFVSGYAAGAKGHHRIPVDGIHFLPKPFTPDALLQRAREILDAPVPAMSS